MTKMLKSLQKIYIPNVFLYIKLFRFRLKSSKIISKVILSSLSNSDTENTKKLIKMFDKVMNFIELFASFIYKSKEMLFLFYKCLETFFSYYGFTFSSGFRSASREYIVRAQNIYKN